MTVALNDPVTIVAIISLCVTVFGMGYLGGYGDAARKAHVAELNVRNWQQAAIYWQSLYEEIMLDLANGDEE